MLPSTHDALAECLTENQESSFITGLLATEAMARLVVVSIVGATFSAKGLLSVLRFAKIPAQYVVSLFETGSWIKRFFAHSIYSALASMEITSLTNSSLDHEFAKSVPWADSLILMQVEDTIKRKQFEFIHSNIIKIKKIMYELKCTSNPNLTQTSDCQTYQKYLEGWTEKLSQ